jgi:hypothetical protein
MSRSTSFVEIECPTTPRPPHPNAFHAPATTTAAHDGEFCFTQPFKASPLISNAYFGSNKPFGVVGKTLWPSLPTEGINVSRSASHELEDSSESDVSISTWMGVWDSSSATGLDETASPSAPGELGAITTACRDLKRRNGKFYRNGRSS